MLATRLLVFGLTLLVVLVATVLSVRGWDSIVSVMSPGWLSPGCRQPCQPFQIVWLGDILLGDRSQPHLDQFGYEWPFEHVRPLLADAFVIGNAEGPITTRSEPYFPRQRWTYNAQPAAATALAAVGFNALGLSNNHALDRGPEGLRDTIKYATAAGLRTFGAGMTLDEAAAPLLVETGWGTVAVLGFGPTWQYGAVAGPEQAGTVTYTPEAIRQLRESAVAAGARWIVAYVHWGENYRTVTVEQRRVAREFARAGYQLVIGAHSHLAQEIEVIEGMPVLYSLGNFTFGTSGGFSRDIPGLSLVARTAFAHDGLQSIELACIATDNDIVAYQPRPCNASQIRQITRRIGSTVTWKGEKGAVDLRGIAR